MSRRIRATIAYDGTNYFGWQIQPGLPTIQSTLQSALTEIESRPVQVTASGRTDAGVHALAQIAAFDLSNPIPLPNLRKALNRLLPHDIRILHLQPAPPDFHPRHHAISKTYEYRIFREEVCPPFQRLYVHHHPYPLQLPPMFEAAALLTGTHDFSAFAAADLKDHLGHSKVRTIFASQLIPVVPTESRGPSNTPASISEYASPDPHPNLNPHRPPTLLIYRVTGSGFLKHMVRNIVGALLEVGKGNLAPSDWPRFYDPTQSPTKAGPTVPPQGLFLLEVNY
jgi:tRNA pseudouridine38-40 synthase